VTKRNPGSFWEFEQVAAALPLSSESRLRLDKFIVQTSRIPNTWEREEEEKEVVLESRENVSNRAEGGLGLS
jgi:hypothetical protein